MTPDELRGMVHFIYRCEAGHQSMSVRRLTHCTARAWRDGAAYGPECGVEMEDARVDAQHYWDALDEIERLEGLVREAHLHDEGRCESGCGWRYVHSPFVSAASHQREAAAAHAAHVEAILRGDA